MPEAEPKKAGGKKPDKKDKKGQGRDFLVADRSLRPDHVSIALSSFICRAGWLVDPTLCTPGTDAMCWSFLSWISSTTQMFHKRIFEWWWGGRNFERGVCTIGEWNVGERFASMRWLIPKFYVIWWKMCLVGRKIGPATFCAGSHTSVWSGFLAKSPSFRIENIDY